MNSAQIRKTISKLLKIVSMVFPVKKNRILFINSYSSYSCNPKYICEYIRKNYGNKFHLVFVIGDKNERLQLKSFGIKTCSHFSLGLFYYAFTSKTIVVNHNLPEFLPKKKEQILINTWHGGGSYKYLKDKHPDQKEFADINKFISSCQSFCDNNLNNQFFGDDRILKIGMPRNDIFFGDTDSIAKSVKEKLNISQDKKIILYAPTYRASHSKEHLSSDFKKIINACEKRFGGEFVFINRDHHFSLDNNNDEKNDDFVCESDIISDTQELICATDILITDYSSIMWDASFSKASCFIYAYDLEEYYKIWDFYTPIEQWPFPVGKTIDELCDLILSFDEEKYKSDVQEHHKALGSFENGTACKQVTEYILKATGLDK